MRKSINVDKEEFCNMDVNFSTGYTHGYGSLCHGSLCHGSLCHGSLCHGSLCHGSLCHGSLLN